MHTRIKICCIRDEVEARVAVTAGADAIGFVGVSPPNSRSIAEERIAQIAATLSPSVASVLLTSESAADKIVSQVRRTGVSTVQILAHIEPSESEALAEAITHIRRVQVIHVESYEALDLIHHYSQFVHAFLLDSGRPTASIPEFGGTGRVHDWEISARFVSQSPLPVILAGGLTSRNVGDAIRRVRPCGVDVCSGVRRAGRLDERQLQEFVSAVKAADMDGE